MTSLRHALLAVSFGLILFVLGCGAIPTDSSPTDPGGGAGGSPDPGILPASVVDETDAAYGDYNIVAAKTDKSSSNWDFTVQARRGLNDNLAFEWDFGDGRTYGGLTQSFTFDGPGTYQIMVTAYDQQGNKAFVLTLNLDVVDGNQPPVANAGANLATSSNQLVFLYGGGSFDPDDTGLVYEWAQLSGPPVSLLDTSFPTARFVAPLVAGSKVLEFGLTVSDGQLSSQDEVSVTVAPILETVSTGPTADAGVDQHVNAGDLVILDGGGSSGSGPLTFSWTQLTGSGVALTGGDSDIATFIAPAVAGASETFTFELTVTDGDTVAADEVAVSVAGDLTQDTSCTTDSDGDGTFDCNDGCPADPTKTSPGACGCGQADTDSDGDGVADCTDRCPGSPDVDNDGDGVLNCLDECPDDPAKTAPGICGCGIADIDSDGNGTPDCAEACPVGTGGDNDGDGVPNCLDECPNDPRKTAPGVCGCGSADSDSDGDGVLDCVDRCPGAPDVDSDRDGVLNCLDGCPTDANKTAPGTCGCGVADTDSDSDGTPNCHDTCPADANKTAPGDCGCGVADTDADGNGVADCLESLSNVAYDEDFAAYATGGNAQDWRDTDANNSLATNDALFKVFDISGNHVLGTSSAGTNVHSHYIGAGSAQWSSLTFTGRMRMTSSDSGIGVTFLSSYPGSDTYYRLRRYSGNGFHISPHGTTINGGTTDSGVIPTANVWYKYHIEVDVVGTRTDIRANVWLDGISEPSGWQINCYSTGADRLSAGTVGVWAMGGGNKYWDDFAVELVDCGGDADGDGVADCVDQCPGQPDTDSDGDGTPNCTDGCPNDPAKTAAGACGCGVADTDSDNNGTADCIEPAKLCVSASTLSFGSSAASASFDAWNCGGDSLNYSVTDNAGWLTVSPTSGSSSGERDSLSATVNRAGLSDGSYQAEIKVTPSVGTAVSIIVNITVGVSTGQSMSTANRTSGIAPLSVFFDAVNVASGVVQPTNGDYAALHYEWDFGDPGSGNWTNGRQNADGSYPSRNSATGYVAAHVFESAGTHTVSLRVTTPSGQTHQYTQDVTVTNPATAPGWTTYYVSSSTGDDANSGTSAATPFRTFSKGMQFAVTNSRVLFKRGDSWTTANGKKLFSPGPGIIGAYGYGAKPVVTVTDAGGYGFSFSGEDWRIMDVEVVGPGSVSTVPGIGGSTSPKWVNGLVLRVSVRGFRTGVEVARWLTDPHDGNMVVDCDIRAIEINGMYVGGARIAVLGTRVQDITVSHALRVWQAAKGVISNNTLANPGATRHALKLHSPIYGTGHAMTKYVVVSDNLVKGSTWSAVIGPQNTTSDERISDVVFERNMNLVKGSEVTIGLLVSAVNVTVRNNVFDGTGGANGFSAIAITQHGVVPPSTNVRVLNNTMFRGDTAGSLTGVLVLEQSPSSTIRNNLCVAPAASPRIIGGSGPGMVADHNLVTASPGFTNSNAGDFSLLSGSPAIDQGIGLTDVVNDFLLRVRPQGGGYDLGAYEYRP